MPGPHVTGEGEAWLRVRVRENLDGGQGLASVYISSPGGRWYAVADIADLRGLDFLPWVAPVPAEPIAATPSFT